MAQHPRIPGYRIEREVGRGGIATVYLARQESLDRNVALKVMSPALVSESSFTERFLREGQTIARLNHPCIVTIYDIEVVDFQPYIAMEYLSGGSLKEKLRARISPQAALAVIGQITAALSYAHRKGVVHRDVKPENILFRDQKSAVLTDFGIAKTAAKDPNLTTAGIIIGTPRYMSPEQADGRGADHRSDVYALGVILYELLTGTAPYDGKDSIGLLYAHINEPIPQLPGELSGFQALIDGMMAKDPKQRMRDCAEVMTMIRRLRSDGLVVPGVSERPVSGSVVSSRLRKRAAKRAVWTKPAISGAAVVAMLVFGVWYTLNRDTVPETMPPRDESAAIAGLTLDAGGAKAEQPPLPVPRPAATQDHRELEVEAAPEDARIQPVAAHLETAQRSVAIAPQDARTRPVAVHAKTGQRPATVASTRERIDAPHIDSLLKLAEKQIELGQLSRPPGDNAVETYRSVLRQRPDHPQAVMGLRRVTDAYLGHARRAVANKDYVEAKSNIESGLKITADDKNLYVLLTRVNRVLEAEREFAQGMKYKNGDGVPKDIAQAIKNLSRAAALGHAQAQYRLGLAYANGVGAIRDEEQALRWLRHAAEQGDPEAQFNFGLGLLFGPSPDPVRAARWMKRLGEEDYKPAYRVLGWMYGTGTGTERSIKQSLRWYFKREMRNMFGEPALPEHVISIWQEQFERALSESTQGVEADSLQSG